MCNVDFNACFCVTSWLLNLPARGVVKAGYHGGGKRAAKKADESHSTPSEILNYLRHHFEQGYSSHSLISISYKLYEQAPHIICARQIRDAGICSLPIFIFYLFLGNVVPKAIVQMLTCHTIDLLKFLCPALDQNSIN